MAILNYFHVQLVMVTSQLGVVAKVTIVQAKSRLFQLRGVAAEKALTKHTGL